MRHRYSAGLAALLALLAAGCGGDDDDGARPERDASPRADAVSLREQLGTLLVSSFTGTTLPAYLERRLKAGETVGVILFGGNAPTRAGTKKLSASIQEAAGGDALVMTDQEGGDIRSLVFTDTREGIREAGVNINLAPVADVAQPGSVMEGRAFSGDVSDQTVAEVNALRGAGVLPTVKHFPGLGRALENTDDAPVTIEATRGELETDLAPFRAAIEVDVPLVMASHAVYSALDPSRIASQSPRILDTLLRAELGFDGVLITDSMEAEAVLARASVEVAAERALAAGADLILMTGQGSWIHVFPYLLKRAKKSPALRERIAESYERVERLKAELARRPPSRDR